MTDGEGKIGKFETHLVQIGDHRYLDLYPLEPDLSENDFYKGHLIPSHTFMQLRQIEPHLQLSPMGPGAIENLLEENPSAVKHEVVQNSIVLTAQPEQLQAFIKKYHAYEDLFGEADDMDRVQ